MSAYEEVFKRVRKTIKGSISYHFLLTCNPTGLNYFYQEWINESNKRNIRQTSGK